LQSKIVEIDRAKNQQILSFNQLVTQYSDRIRNIAEEMVHKQQQQDRKIREQAELKQKKAEREMRRSESERSTRSSISTKSTS
jgi:Na+-translocating ferredoxin:NAD+ oxidoreductase RnfC subunit